MIPLTTHEIADITGGKMVAGSPNPSSGISIDSREVKEGDLFVAFKGANVDGHEYISEAIRKGATNVLVSRDDITADDGCGVILVKDCTYALQNIAYYLTGNLKARVVGITGSCGKTTTKDILYHLLKDDFITVCSENSYNNELGLPLTISRADDKTELILLEMGMRGKGQIKDLCMVAKPRYGLITNIGVGHMELLGSETNIAKAKAELAECLPGDGTLFINSGNKWLDLVKNSTKAKIVVFGEDEFADIRLKIIEMNASKSVFEIFHEGENAVFEAPLPGKHIVENIIAACSVALGLGVNLADLPGKVAGISLSPNRTDIKQTGEFTIINDSYNANPESMKAALDLLNNYEGRKVAILGDMLELGEESRRFHLSIGKYAAVAGVDVLITVGVESRGMSEGFGSDKKDDAIYNHFDSADEVCGKIDSFVKKGDVILVKGSRLMAMERVAEYLEGVKSC